jgi:Ca-activated chloride channel family protein
VSTLSQLSALLGREIADWQTFRVADLDFWHRTEGWMAIGGLLAAAVILLMVRLLIRHSARPRGVVVPALLGARLRRAPLLVHAPAALFVVGIPCFVIALADPFTALVSREATFPGRRIVIAIDASISMRGSFPTTELKTGGPTSMTFFTAVSAAERFVQLRITRKYRDLIGLVEFGNQAYVIVPFTSDYDNVLTSISLIGDQRELNQFPDGGTIIMQAINQTVDLYKTFNFLEASGNLMVIFTDGDDAVYQLGQMTLDQVMQTAVDARIPVYFVRTNFRRERGRVIPDQRWIPAVEKTGGKFYAASDEKTLLAAIHDIDRLATGTIEFKQYSSQQPRFTMFALIAAAFWSGAAGLKLGAAYFEKIS